jgi:hypothetical protein
MKESISKVFRNLQNLDIQPTEKNVMLLAECLINLKEVFAALPDEQPQLEVVPEENSETEKAEEPSEEEDEDG